jgi:S1-C subfamily serine protease
VVLSIDKGSAADVLGVRAGDFVTSVGGAPAPSIDALKTQLGDEWARTSPGSAMTLDVESAGAKRPVRFTKPSR